MADDPVILRPNESETWQWLSDLAEESSRVRKTEARMDSASATEDLNIFYGKHWPDALPTFKPPVTANELRTLILSEASDLSEGRLRVYITRNPTTGNRDEAAERAFRAIWMREQIDIKLMLASVWAMILGTGFLQWGWDPDLSGGLGDITLSELDPRTVYPDPDATDDRKWAYVIKETVMDLGEIRRLFPLTGKLVRPEDTYSQKSGSNDRSGGPMSAAYTGPMYSGTGLSGQFPGYKKARARILDAYVLDDTVETRIEELKDSSGRPILDGSGMPILSEKTVYKYPHGRRIVGANGTILADIANPAPDFGIVRVLLEPAPGQFWGHGFVQQTKELQLAADKLLSSVVENAVRLNNGMVVATSNTGLDWESFASIPGQIVVINPGSQFDIKYPDPMPPDMIQAPWRMLDMQRRVLGFPDSRVGVGGRGNISAELTETEIAQAQGPTRLRGRMLHATVQRMAEQLFARMAMFYTVPRAIPSVEGEGFKPTQWIPIENPSQYQVYVDPASFQVMSQTMLRRLSVALFKLKAIDRDALLETIGWPNWGEVSDRLKKMEQLAAITEYNKKVKK